MKQPQHPAGHAFVDARNLMAFYEQNLQGPEKQRYNEFRDQQKKERKQQKQKFAEARNALEESRKKRPEAVKNYDPPIKIQNPQNQLYEKRASIEKTKLMELALTQKQDRLLFLEKSDKQRLATQKKPQQHTRGKRERQAVTESAFRENARDATRRKATPSFDRAARATPAKDTALSKAFEKARERNSQDEIEKNKNNEHNNSRKL